MSPSTRAEPKFRIPFQPNPFGSVAHGSPWGSESADVAEINAESYRKILRELGQIRAGGQGTSIVLIGEPGTGKTHLLARLRSQVVQDGAFYVYVRCNASAGTLWRHVRQAVASDLLKQRAWLDTNFGKIEHRGLRLVLENLKEGRHAHAASAWLRGETLGEADVVALGLATEREDEDTNREAEAQQIVHAILDFVAPTPVVICFDQVEALETYHGEETGFLRLGQTIAELNDGHSHLLLISCVISAFEEKLDRVPNGADRDRWLQHKALLRPIDWDHAVALIRARLHMARGIPRRDDSVWPLDDHELRQLFAATGLSTPRTILQACRRQFDALMGDASVGGIGPHRPKERGVFLQEQFSLRLAEARRVVASQGMAKTLADCLPWLMERSGFAPLAQDAHRSRYAGQAWRGAEGGTAFAFVDGRGVALFNQLRRIEQAWAPEAIRLSMVRDAAVRPGPKGAGILRKLRERGAREVHPLPEALAALQAIRDLLTTARSGELFNGDEMVSEHDASAWALANLPEPVKALRDELTGATPEAVDEIMERLAVLIAERKAMAASAAADELQLKTEEVTSCAVRHPGRFGVLGGPPVVIFQAVFEAAATAR